jgi:ribose 5-phosphate isomerase B
LKIAIGSDHAAFELKEYIKQTLHELGHSVSDLGTKTEGPVDYPEFGIKVAELVARRAVDRGILLCGTGIGMSVVANKVKGVRAALVHEPYGAAQSRRHLDANVLVLGGRVIGKGMADEILKIWLDTLFEGGRHKRRIDQISNWEEGTLAQT